MLTERENLLEVIHRGNPDRFANEFDAFKTVRSPMQVHRNAPKPGEVNKVDAWGCTASWEDGQPGIFPVHKPGLIVMPDIEEWRSTVKAPLNKFPESEWEPFIEQAEAIDRSQYFVMTSWAPGIFELCHYLGEITNVLAAFYESPNALKDLIKYITEWEMGIVEGICDHYHPDAVFHHDDWGTSISTFISPEMFEEFLLDSYKQIYGYYHDHGVEVIIHHSDTYGATLVPYMIDMGINIWQGVLSNNNIPELIEKYGDRISFMGGIDSNKVDTPDWTKEYIQSYVDKTLEQCGPLSFIPCTTQGADVSTYPGVYETVHEAIDDYSARYFETKR